MTDDIDENGDDWEQPIYFTGCTFTGCTCEHDSDEHGWGSCDVEGCPLRRRVGRVMSADNYYDVFNLGAQWYCSHKFASFCWYGEEDDSEVDAANLEAEMRAVQCGPRFNTQDEALKFAENQFSEYGVNVVRTRISLQS